MNQEGAPGYPIYRPAVQSNAKDDAPPAHKIVARVYPHRTKLWAEQQIFKSNNPQKRRAHSSLHRRVESRRIPGGVAKLGPLARGSGLPGALFRAPVNLDTRASGLSFVIAPGRPPPVNESSPKEYGPPWVYPQRTKLWPRVYPRRTKLPAQAS